ncbi:MAG: hypothetical protein NXY57DRAFT_55402 [Lentinula lateritia]|nr:MAG: hypothetical protein NXY57DRAFT_55402 [Lentinula lateritia]
MKINPLSLTAFAALVVLAVAEPSSDPRGTLDTSLWGSSKSRNSWAKSKMSKNLSNPSSAKKLCIDGDNEWCTQAQALCRRRRSSWYKCRRPVSPPQS